MTFSLVASAEPDHVPPRVLLTATESDIDKPLQSCTFFRGGVPLRFSAAVGGGIAFAYDYDAPFDVALEYRADATEWASLEAAWSDTFTDLSAWSGPGGSPSNWTATGGKAQAITETASMSRGTGAAPIVKISGTNPAFTGSATTGQFALVVTNDADQIVASLTFSLEDQNITLVGDTVASVAHVPNSFEILFAEDSVTASGSGWSLTVPYHSDYDLTGVILQVSGTFTGTRTVTLDDLTVYTPVMPAVLDDVTATDTTGLFGITGAWLTNTAVPDLALVVDDCSEADPDYYLTEESGRTTVARSSSVQLDIEGSSSARTVITGPRKDKTFSLEVAVKDFAALGALDAVLANNATVNLRFPATMTDLGIPDGFYDIGDVTETRVEATPRIRQQTVVQMPLTPSAGVSVDALWAWNLRTLAQTGMTLRDVANTFPTLRALLIGPTT